MKRKIYDMLIFLMLIAWAIALLCLPKLTSEAVVSGLSLCAMTLLPSLFPFFVCANLFCQLGLAEKVAHFTSPVMRPLFHDEGAGASALVLGLIGGYPTGAQTIVSLYTSGQITNKQASSLLQFCSNCGPAFLLGVIGTGLFGSARIGLALYLIHIISAVLVGVFLRPKQFPQATTTQVRHAPNISFSSAFTASVKAAGQSALLVCMFVVTFRVLTVLLLHLFSNAPSLIQVILAGILELSGGIHALSQCQLPRTLLLCLSSFFAGFGGLGVYAQTMALFEGTSINTSRYLLSKVLHGAVSAVLTAVSYSLFPSVFFAEQAGSFAQHSPRFLQFIPLWLAAAIICLLFRKLEGGNLRKKRV